MTTHPLVSEGNPIAADIREESFTAPYDGTRQTFLIAKNEGSGPPLLVLYLHGAASRQDQGMTAEIYNDFFGRLWRWLQPRHAAYVCPDYRGPSWMGPAAESDVVTIIEQLRTRFKPAKVLLTGGSMGGTSALIFAARHPELVDGVFALCPATDTAEIFEAFSAQLTPSYGGSPAEQPAEYRARSSRYHAAQLARVPIAIVHGDDDALLPVDHSRELVAALRKHDARLHYVEHSGCGHDALAPADVPAAMNFLLRESATA